MSLDRRTFLQGMGVTALTALTACSARASGARTATVLPAWTPGSDAAFWRAVRQNYPLLDDPLYLNTGGLGPTPQRVLDTVFNTMSQLQQHSETGYNLYEPAREVLAEFLGVQTNEVAFVRNATEANCIIAGGLDLRAGDEIIFETHAHPGGSFPWLNQGTRRGAVVRLFEHSTASDEENLERIKGLVTPRTKVIQVSHITCTDG
jgi:selenocysteine lyase/cysteine desulfurase